MEWTPETTIRNALWIGGGQWAGKTTVSEILAWRYGLTHYHFDRFANRSHEERRAAAAAGRGEPVPAYDWETYWVVQEPEETARQVLDGFRDGFAWVLDDLSNLTSPRPLVVDGWGLRPELVMKSIDDSGRMVVMVPTGEWRSRQAAQLPRAGAVSAKVSDPVRAQANRLERDRLVALDAVRSANELGIRVIEVDGSRNPEAIADEVAGHFEAYL